MAWRNVPPRIAHSPHPPDSPFTGRLVILTGVAVAALGAIAPVTDDDALTYVIPQAMRLAETGVLRVWPDQLAGMWPQSQQVLLAWMIRFGADQLGALSAFELLLAVGAIVVLAREALADEQRRGLAIAIAIGAPVAASLAASAKEDLLVVAATAGVAACLIRRDRLQTDVLCGVLAGVAAGAKYPGLLVAIGAVIAALAIPGGRLRRASIIAFVAAATGGLWYALNIARAGNPVAPFVWGAPGIDPATLREWLGVYGSGQTPRVIAFVMAPVLMFLEPGRYSAWFNLFNPLVLVAIWGLVRLVEGNRVVSEHRPLWIMAGVYYVGWFFGLQNARLLWPVAVLLSPIAADVIAGWRAPVRALTAACAALLIVIGGMRLVSYAQSPSTFVARETIGYADIAWMNANLDRTKHRVLLDAKEGALLEIPYLYLDDLYQDVIARDELRDPVRLLAACRREGVTHLFGQADTFAPIAHELRALHTNRASGTAVFEILRPAVH